MNEKDPKLKLAQGTGEKHSTDPEHTTSDVHDLLEEILHASRGPLPQDLLVRATASFLGFSEEEALLQVQKTIAAPGALEKLPDDSYELVFRLVEYNRVRLVPGPQEFSFGYLALTEAERCLLCPDAFLNPDSTDRSLEIQLNPTTSFPETIREPMTYGEKGTWRLSGLGTWFDETKVRSGMSVIIEVTDPWVPRITLDAEESEKLDPSLTNERDRDLAEKSAAILASLGGGPHLLFFLMRRLIAQRFFSDAVPPRPICEVLSKDPRFQLDPIRSTVQLLEATHEPTEQDPLGAEEPRYLGRDQTQPSGRELNPVTLACRRCDRSFIETEPFPVTLEGSSLVAGSCPDCQKVVVGKAP